MENKKIVRVFQIILIIGMLTLFILMLTTNNNLESDVNNATTLPSTTVSTSIPLKDDPVLYEHIIGYEFENINDAEQFIAEATKAVEALTIELTLIDTYTQNALEKMSAEIVRLSKEIESAEYQKAVFIKWQEKENEYYYATKTWQYLKDLGYSDVACAGILGNLMAECGGHTLKLDPFLYDAATGNYYGMFQWSIHYYPRAEGMTFEEQLDYYAETSIPIFKTWGKEYYNGFTLDDFNKLTDPRDAALAFAKVYERCASWTYERRQNFSEVAYKYFVSDFEVIK